MPNFSATLFHFFLRFSQILENREFTFEHLIIETLDNRGMIEFGMKFPWNFFYLLMGYIFQGVILHKKIKQ